MSINIFSKSANNKPKQIKNEEITTTNTNLSSKNTKNNNTESNINNNNNNNNNNDEISITKKEKKENVINKTNFEDLGLHQWIITACKEMGFQNPTTVQEECIPQILEGKNCIGAAETGSGKTAAFALPILHSLSNDPYGIFAIILTPTR